MTKLCFILGDQLNDEIASLNLINKEHDVVFMCEVADEADYVPHHPKKIAFLFSAMRHFAQHLEKNGYKVLYTRLDDPDNGGSFARELLRITEKLNPTEIIVVEPGEWRVLQILEQLKAKLKIPLTILEDNRFLCSINHFKEWAKGKKQLRMEYFYRTMRQKYNLLLDKNAKPVGGSWNYDSENRRNANQVQTFPTRPQHQLDHITKEVLALVEKNFANNFGELLPFALAVTRKQALIELDFFITHCLPNFGDYQDAMRDDEAILFHAYLSFYLNAGLLLPLEICQKAEKAYYDGAAPLNAVEGFIRQILGWREFIRGIYWFYMPEYREKNFFQARRSLPALYWGAETKMHCMKKVVQQTSTGAYSHHIQRLMVSGNFALLAGINPEEVCAWYLAVYADAYEWVELPNTLGMALFADGGLVGSKPYAASGKYIHRMSNFCSACHYNPNQMTEERACPFNALYWDFLERNQQKLVGNPRLNYAYLNWRKMTDERKQAILSKAKKIFSLLDSGVL